MRVSVNAIVAVQEQVPNPIDSMSWLTGSTIGASRVYLLRVVNIGEDGKPLVLEEVGNLRFPIVEGKVPQNHIDQVIQLVNKDFAYTDLQDVLRMVKELDLKTGDQL